MFSFRHKIFSVFVTFVCFNVFYIYWNRVDQNSVGQNENETDLSEEIEIISQPMKKDDTLVVDTPGCRIPKLDPYDKSLRDIIDKPTDYVCPGKPLFFYSRPGGSIELNETVLELHYNMTWKDVKCYYEPILRMPEAAGETLEDYYAMGNSRKLHFGIPLQVDAAKIECYLKDETFTHFIPLVPIKADLEEKKNKLFENATEKLNVVMIGIDSVSALNFQRQFLKTRAFIEANLQPIKLDGYTKVGDNTFPNLVPLLTGHFVEYYWNETLYHTKFFDDLNYVWKAFSNKGYRTFFAEDSPRFGTFNYGKRGFRDAPTDYYYRPLALAYYDYGPYKNSKLSCLNSQIDANLILNYLRDFVKTMDWRPYFAFAMVSTLTHDYLNSAGHADEPILRLFTEFLENGVFNKSLVILFSDHGIRFGKIRETYIGKFEERMPFIYLNFPPWFLKKYPKLSKHLHENQDRLTSHFDVHATLVHLQEVMKVTDETSFKDNEAHGLSLMGKIPITRTCEDASIKPHWCPCQTFHNISTSDNATLESANAIIEHINKKLIPYPKCALLELDKIVSAELRQVNEVVLRFLHHESIVINSKVVLGKKIDNIRDYLITVVAKPSGGLFECTVRHRIDENSFEVLGISRINAYGDQSKCIQSFEMRIYCYCKL